MKQIFPHTKIGTKLCIAAILLVILFVRGCSCEEKRDGGNSHIGGNIVNDTILKHSFRVDNMLSKPRKAPRLANADGTPIKHKIIGVEDCNEYFCDMNDVQLSTAKRLGIDLIADREEAQQHKEKLVFINDNPFYRVEHLSHSIPYLVPRAARLLNEISRNFVDSLQCKGLPFYKLIITSVLRTQKDVERLRRINGNASENSCHRYATTFDICYNSFYRVIDPEDKSKRQVWDGRLRDVLAEVLRDLREQGICYVRYEAHQACFHITAR